ncbi:hypothetical protein QQ045_018771 [Rhodiola kirilowii]
MDQTWIRGPVIGRGATSTVSLAFSSSDPNRQFALKSSHISNSAVLQNEHNIISKLMPHPNIIASFGFHVSGQHCNLVTEYVPGGTLADRVKRNRMKLTEPLVQFYTCQILTGLDFLHANGVVHCDLKSENLLLGEDGSVKIADLGFSKVAGSVDETTAFRGTAAFMAPEVARGEAQGFAADVWALGCVIVEMVTGKNPWPEERNPVSALYRIGFSGDVPTIPDWLSEKGRDFVGKCLTKEAKERWTARELLNHPFVNEFETVNESLVKTRSSPTCVLDLALWDQLDADYDGDVASSSSEAERIEGLHSGPPSTSSWNFNENWITVRRTECCIHQRSEITRSDRIHQIDLVSNWDHEDCVVDDDKLLVSADDDCVCVLLNFTCRMIPHWDNC